MYAARVASSISRRTGMPGRWGSKFGLMATGRSRARMRTAMSATSTATAGAVVRPGDWDARDVDEVVRAAAALDDEILLERRRAHTGEIGDDVALGQRGHS